MKIKSKVPVFSGPKSICLGKQKLFEYRPIILDDLGIEKPLLLYHQDRGYNLNGKQTVDGEPSIL